MTEQADLDLSEPPTPDDSPLRMRDVLESPLYRDLMTSKLEVGGPAFDFELTQLDGVAVRLSSHAGRQPVSLAFGSYT
jgi:hypothetical protein